MSALLHIKNLIIVNLKCDSELKDAIMYVFNNIDSDLDINGYETSTATDEAIDYLDKVLCQEAQEEEEEEVIEEEETEVLEDVE